MKYEGQKVELRAQAVLLLEKYQSFSLSTGLEDEEVLT
jgi:hypothetical protein